MTRKLLLVSLSLLFVASAGCHDEPTFVITFAPQDLSNAATPVAAAVDAGGAATTKDAAAAAVKTPAPSPAPAIACKTVADCALEPVDCCDCKNGGKQQVIAKANAAAHAKARAARCKDQMCNTMMSPDESCGMVAGCVEGKCALVAKAATKK